MPATTYTTLLTQVRDYLERGFTEESDPIVFNQLPNLITLGERRCALELKIQGFINVVTSTMAPGSSGSVIAKPDRWRETISFNVGTGTDNNTRSPVLPRSYEYCRAYWPDPTQTGTPQFYSDYSYTHWLVVPSPASAFPFEVVFYQLLPLLSEANQSNWLTDYAPQLLLYATLLEATPFLKNDERIPTWQGMYDRTAAALSGEDIQKILDRNAERKAA